MAADGELVVGGTTIEPGSRQVVRIRVTQDLDGGEIALYVHAIRGTKPGPTLALTTAQHGDEWFGPMAFQQIIPSIDPEKLSGTVLAIPVCNPVAFGQGQRNTQHESDGPDMNRVWPGTHTWHAESMTKVISREVLQKADALIDFHPSPWGSAMGQVVYGGDLEDPDLVERQYQMGIAFGWENLGRGALIEVFPGPRSIRAYTGVKLGIPSINSEVGGSGFSHEEEQSWVQQNVIGVHNVMKYLGMEEGEITKRDRILHYRRTMRVNPTIAGLLLPKNEPERFNREVKEGELLGTIVSPYTFEVLEELRAPCDGYIVFKARSYPIRPGHWAFGVAIGAECEWVTPQDISAGGGRP